MFLASNYSHTDSRESTRKEYRKRTYDIDEKNLQIAVDWIISYLIKQKN
jgi:hypothetical protein